MECQQVWCGGCYRPLDVNEFPIARPTDEEGNIVLAEEDHDRFVVARNGDNLVTPFQCDLSHFRNLMERDPVNGLPQDLRLLKLIRRANLDALWAREPGTVNGTLLTCQQGGRIAASLGFKNKLFKPMGPFPVCDSCGMGAAVVMLQQSLRPGKNDKTIQFASVRKFRSAFSNVYHASAEGQQAMVMAKDTRKMSVTKCPTYGEFFERFMRGMHKRMGEISRLDRALSLDVLLEICRILEREWEESFTDKMTLAMEASFYLVAFCCALRGEEIQLTNLFGMLKHWDAGEIAETKHVVIPLLGRFKGETGENYHLLCVVDVTPRGLHPRKWIGRLLEMYNSLGIRSGPFFCDLKGQRLKARHFEPRFFDRLEMVKATQPHLLAGVEIIEDEFRVSRSFRRGATSEAVNQGAKPDIIDANNRWRRVEQAGASNPSLSMREHYTDVRLTLKQRLQFSKFL